MLVTGSGCENLIKINKVREQTRTLVTFKSPAFSVRMWFDSRLRHNQWRN